MSSYNAYFGLKTNHLALKLVNLREASLAEVHLARSSDPPPGNNVLWRGLQRLTEIQIGVEIGIKLVGN